MHKTEIICDSCENHYILVTKDPILPEYCPFCGEVIASEDEESSEEEE